MEPTLEERTVTEVSKEEAMELVGRLAELHPKYKGMNPREKERLAEHLVKNPNQYHVLVPEVPEIRPEEINQRLRSFRDVLQEAQGAYDAAFMPENPEFFYTPSEQRRLRRLEIADTMLGFAGTTFAEKYRSSMKPVVRERFKEHLTTKLDDAVSELDQMNTQIEQLYDQTIDSLVQSQRTVAQQMNDIEIAEGRLITIAGEIEDLQKKVRSYEQAGSEHNEFRSELSELRHERSIYERGKRLSANNISISELRIGRGRYMLGLIAPLVDEVMDFWAEMDLLAGSIKLYMDDQFSVLNPEAMIRLGGVRDQAQRVLSDLDKSFEATTVAVRDAIPKRLTAGYESGIKMAGLEDDDLGYRMRQNDRLENAKTAGRKIMEMEIPYA